MNTKQANPAKLWAREPPGRIGPIRNAGGFYRSADSGGTTGGVPLTTANAAVVAAVRLAYKVAEAQIDRSASLAKRLRAAGDQAVGPGSERQALDATERLVMKALMSGLAWWEGSVAEGRCPVKRLAAAEYQLLGSMLGLTTAPLAKARKDAKHARPEDSRENHPGQAGQPHPPASRERLLIVHKGEKKNRRAVVVEHWRIDSPDPLQTTVYFFCVDAIDKEPFDAELIVSAQRGGARLFLTTSPTTTPGRWRGAICDEHDEQVGMIEISL